MLANRFLINLRSINNPSRTQFESSFHASRFSAPNFQIPDHILGNIGGSLQDGDSEVHETALDEQEMSGLESEPKFNAQSPTESISLQSEAAPAPPMLEPRGSETVSMTSV